MQRVRLGTMFFAAVVILTPCAVAWSQQFSDLISRIPSGANTLVLLNVDKILNSPVAVREDWRSKHEQTYASGLSLVPPDAKQAVFATDLALDDMTPQWESVVMRLDGGADLSSLASQSGGQLETIGQYKAVAIPSSAYAVQFSSDVVGALTPVSRQGASRWVASTETPSRTNLTPYLTEAFGYANNLGTPIILAMDLQDAASADQVYGLLKASEQFANQPDSEMRRLARVVAGIRGLTLGITLGDTTFGKVKVDFAEDIGVSPDLAKAMLLHALAKRGAMLKELNDWTPKVNGRQVTLEGDLTSSGMKRIFSLFDRPPSFRKVPTPPAPSSPVAEERSKVYAAQAYYKRVADYVSDLKSNSYSASTFGSIALWYETYARKIDQLPVVGIDPELVAYAGNTANLMRQASMEIKGANYRKGVRQANASPAPDNSNYNWGWGTSYSNAPNAEQRTARIEETATAGMSSAQIMQQIESDTAAIRQKMSLKYKENF